MSAVHVDWPEDLQRWRALQEAGTPTVWGENGIRFLAPDEAPDMADTSYLTDEDRANADIVANVEATLHTFERITWVAEDDGEFAFGYWRGSADPSVDGAPIVSVDSEWQFAVLPGETLTEALAAHLAGFADEDDAEGEFAAIAARCRDVGVECAAESLEALVEPVVQLDPGEYRDELYEWMRVQ